MRNIKSKKADLERKRSLFFQIGLIIAISTVLAAFEWGTKISKEKLSYSVDGIELETELIPVTRTTEIKPPPPKQYEKFKIVDNKEHVNEPEAVSTEADPSEAVQIYPAEIEEPVEKDDEPIFFSEVKPEPPGGMIGLKHYLAKNVKYPPEAAESDIQGKVYVRFVVNKNGQVENVRIIRGVHPLLDKEALRVIKNMPKWKAGEQSGKPVSVWFTVPVVFVLQ